jgi:hypothetical protein
MTEVNSVDDRKLRQLSLSMNPAILRGLLEEFVGAKDRVWPEEILVHMIADYAVELRDAWLSSTELERTELRVTGSN